MTLTKKRSSWLITAPLTIGSVVYLLLVFLPGTQKIADMRRELKLRRDFITSSVQTVTAVTDAQRTLDELTAFADRWQQVSPEGPALAELFGSINQQVKASGATPVRFEPQAKIDHQLIQQAPLVVEAKGMFGEICQFVSEIERHPARIWVEQLKIERAREAGKPASCQLKLVVFSDSTASLGGVDPAGGR